MRAKTMHNKIKYTPTGCFVLNDSSGGLIQIEFPDSLHRALSKTTSFHILIYIYIYKLSFHN